MQRSLNRRLRSSQQTEPQQLGIIAQPISNQVESLLLCSEFNKRFDDRAMLPHAGKAANNCSIWHFHSQSLSSFRNFHWKSRHVFVSHNVAGFIWTSNLYLPLRSD